MRCGDADHRIGVTENDQLILLDHDWRKEMAFAAIGGDKPHCLIIAESIRYPLRDLTNWWPASMSPLMARIFYKRNKRAHNQTWCDPLEDPFTSRFARQIHAGIDYRVRQCRFPGVNHSTRITTILYQAHPTSLGVLGEVRWRGAKTLPVSKIYELEITVPTRWWRVVLDAKMPVLKGPNQLSTLCDKYFVLDRNPLTGAVLVMYQDNHGNIVTRTGSMRAGRLELLGEPQPCKQPGE